MRTAIREMLNRSEERMSSESEPRVRVIVGEHVYWMTLDAAKAMHNDMARTAYAFSSHKRRKPNCKHGHPMRGPNANVREYRFKGYVHRTCMTCVYDRLEKAEAKRAKAVAA